MSTDRDEFNVIGRLDEIYSGLEQALADDKEVSIKLLPEGQLLVSKHLVPDPAALSTFKAPRLVPAANGYRIYVRIDRPGTNDRPQQRLMHPAESITSNASAIKLKMDRTSLDQSWQMLNADGNRIVIAVHCGSVAVFDEVDQILNLLSGFLL